MRDKINQLSWLISDMYQWDKFKSYYKYVKKNTGLIEDDLGGWLDGLVQEGIQKRIEGRCSLKAQLDFDMEATEKYVRSLLLQIIRFIQTIDIHTLEKEFITKARIVGILDKAKKIPHIPKATVSEDSWNNNYLVSIKGYARASYIKGKQEADELCAKINADLQSGVLYAKDGEIRKR